MIRSLDRVVWSRAGVHRALAVAAVAAALLVGACDRSREKQSSLFREADDHFVAGEYEAALDDYQAFLRKYPGHRLASTARLRIRSINREIPTVMDREEMPPPRHVAESSDEEAPEPASDLPDAGDGA